MAGVDTSSYNTASLPGPMDAAAQAIGVANGAQALKAGQFDLINKQYGAMHNILGSMVSDPNLSTETVIGNIAHMAKLGLITPQMAATEGSSVYQAGGDPAKLKALVTNHLVQSMSGAEQFNQQYGVQAVDQGPTQSFQRVNRLTNQITPMAGGTFANGLGPGDAAAPTQIGTDPQGRPIMGTKQQFVQRAGGGNALMNGGAPGVGYTPPMAPPAGQGVAMPNAFGVAPPASAPEPMPAAAPVPSSNPALAAGKPPAALAAPAAPAAAAPVSPAAPAPAGGQGIPMGLPVGAEAAAVKAAAAGADQGAALQAAADKAPDNKATIANLEKDLAGFTSGPGADRARTAKAGANAVSGMLGGPAIFDPKSIAAQENFVKQATMLAQQQSQALGGTDASLASAGHSNPNTDFSNMGNAQVMQVLKGNQDAIAAKSGAWQQFKKANGPGADYGTFQTEFNKGYEPRAYQFPYMTPAERTTMFKTMSPNERSQVQSAIEMAEKNGYIKAPSQ